MDQLDMIALIKHAALVLGINLANVDRLKKFFHCSILQQIRSKTQLYYMSLDYLAKVVLWATGILDQ